MPYAEEAKFFVESRLLQRDVEIILESFNNNNFVGTVVHPVCITFLRTRDQEGCEL
jgi:hypothetical protein